MKNELVEKKNEIEVKRDFSIELLIEKAIEKGIPVETMEKLLAMRKELKEERAKESFCEALSNFQSECPIISKLDTANIKTKHGTTFSYKYASLDLIISGVRQHLKKNGFSYTFDTDFKDNCQIVTCTATHIDGYSKTATFRAPIETDAGMSLVQKNGAALTFAKRYAFCQVFGIITGEDNEQQLNDEYENKKQNTQKPQAKEPAKEPVKPQAKESVKETKTEDVTPEIPSEQKESQTNEKVSYYKRLTTFADTQKINIQTLNNYLQKNYNLKSRSEVTEEIYNSITNNLNTIKILLKGSSEVM